MKDVIDTLIIALLLFGFLCWGVWEIIDFFFIKECIKSPTLIYPEIQLVVKNNVIDTVYVYCKDK